MEKGLTWRSWWDGPAGPICRHWHVEYFPTVLVIDHTGVIRYRSDGSPDPPELDRQIDELVEQVPDSVKAGSKRTERAEARVLPRAARDSCAALFRSVRC